MYERRSRALPGSVNPGDELRSELVIGGALLMVLIPEANHVLLQAPETVHVMMLYRSVAYADGSVGVDGDDGITDHGALDHAYAVPRYSGYSCLMLF